MHLSVYPSAVPAKAIREYLIPGAGVTGGCESLTGVMGNEPGSFGSGASALNQEVQSQPH